MGPPNVIKQIKQAEIHIRIFPEKHSPTGIKEKISSMGKIFSISKISTKKIENENYKQAIEDLLLLKFKDKEFLCL